MSGKNNFAVLKQHSTKEYKFKQGASLALRDPSKSANANAFNAVGRGRVRRCETRNLRLSGRGLAA